MKTNDYRNHMKGLTSEQAKGLLEKYQDKLLRNIGVCETNERYYSNCISFIKKEYSLN